MEHPGSSLTKSRSHQEPRGSISSILAELAQEPESTLGDDWDNWLYVGAVIGRFKLVRELGRGGFGVVWEACDEELGRAVAFKAVRPGDRTALREERLLREAEAAAQLSHPNIVTVYDAGRSEHGPYLVLELLRGQPLSELLEHGPLSVREALRIAIEIANGLAHAHVNGVVHRDLKPANVILCEDGQVKVLDFGMAHAFGHRTASGGTPGYMAPEQCRRAPEDERTDVFALGVMLHQMLSGELPFAADNKKAMAGPDPAPPLDIPQLPELGVLLGEMLAKDPVERPRDGAQALAELERVAYLLPQAPDHGSAPVRVRRKGTRRHASLRMVGVTLGALAVGSAIFFGAGNLRRIVRRATPPTVEHSSVAVLPFVNMSRDKEDEYFSDGITEELINALANVEGLHVVSRTSAFALKGKTGNIRQVGAELGVATVVEGSVRREGNALRVAAQLVNAADGYHIWSMTYDRELKNIFAVEEELARSIVRALKAKLVRSEAEPLVRPGTVNLAAHDLYLKGQYFWNKRTPDALTKAIRYFQQAIENDPAYPLAYVGLGVSTAILVEHGSASAEEAFPKAKQAVLKALELDGALAEAHASLGLISLYNFEWGAAAQEFQRAIELKPEYPTAHHWYSILLTHLGRVEEGRAEGERARQLDPTSLVINTNVAETLYAAREYDRAIEQAKKALELDPDFPLGHSFIALAYLSQNRYADAVAELEKIRAHSATFPGRFAGELGYAYAMSGRRAEALRLLAELKGRSGREHVSPSAQALIYMGLGDKDQAFAWLDRAYAERDWRMRQLKSIPLWDSLRSDPRFTSLLKKMHLE